MQFFSDESMPARNNIQGLDERYGHESLSQTQMYCRIKEVDLGQRDSVKIVRAGRAVNESLAIVIANKIRTHPYLSARTRPNSMRIAASIVARYSTNLRTCCFDSAKRILLTVSTRQASIFDFLFTAD
jgi:hypothetical protein